MGRVKRAVVEYRNYELAADFPVMVLTGSEWRISHVPSGRLHIHNCLEIGLCHSERGTLEFNGESAAFQAGDITCIARNVPHTTYSAPGCASLWSYLFLDPEQLLQDLFPYFQGDDPLPIQQMLCSCHMILPSGRHPELRQIVEQIIGEVVARRPYYRENVRGLCVSLFIRLLRAFSEDPGKSDPLGKFMFSIAPAIDYIHNNYMYSFPQSVLAEVCHLSQTHFRRLFHEQMHINPLTFLHQTRILKSCTLLRTRDVPIAEIAGHVGYASLSTYNRNFLRIMGCSPSQWRSSSGENRPSVVTYSGWTSPEEPA